MPKALKRGDIEIHGYVGPNGSGKTWMAMHSDKKMPGQIRIRINPLDPTLAQGAHIISCHKELMGVLSRWSKAGKPEGLCICWDGNKRYGLKKGAELVISIALNVGRIEIIADEAHRYFSRNINSQPAVEALLTQGFHYGVALKWTSTMPRRLAEEFRNQSTTIAIFQGRDTAYLSYLKDLAKEQINPLLNAAKYSHVMIYRDKAAELHPPFKPSRVRMSQLKRSKVF